jgi:DNA-binding XRE family transcriptional regulator
MILNLRDLGIADARITMLKSRCDYLRRRIANPGEAASARAEIERMEMRITELKQQLSWYRDLTSKSSLSSEQVLDNGKPIKELPINEIPQQLIKRRILARLTQAELAKAIRTSRQMIARYERTRYASVSLKRIIQIDAILSMLHKQVN